MPVSFDAAPSGTKKPRILVVDDDAMMRSFLHMVLGTDYDVVEACDGREAIEMLDADDEVACVVSDDRMPRATGFEVAGHVRDTPRLRGVPVILMTAKETNTAVRQAESRAAGAAAFLNKPFTRTQLTMLVHTLVRRRRLRLA